MEVDPSDPSGKTKRRTPLYEEMELLTDNMDELLILMEKHQSEADAIHDNPQVIVQYKARKLEIEKEEAALADLDANFQKVSHSRPSARPHLNPNLTLALDPTRARAFAPAPRWVRARQAGVADLRRRDL